MIQKLQERYKAVIAGLGNLLAFLYIVEAANPNQYVAGAILLLTFLGVHQVANKPVANPQDAVKLG